MRTFHLMIFANVKEILDISDLTSQNKKCVCVCFGFADCQCQLEGKTYLRLWPIQYKISSCLFFFILQSIINVFCFITNFQPVNRKNPAYKVMELQKSVKNIVIGHTTAIIYWCTFIPVLCICCYDLKAVFDEMYTFFIYCN